jgi:N-acetylmuramoyl-L-alanine amidase
MKRFFLSFLAAVYCLFITPVYGDEARGAAHSLQETLKTLDAKLYWDSFFQSGIFSMDGHNLAFQTGVPGEYDYVLYDHNELIRLPLPYIENGKIKFPAEFVSGVRRAFEDSKRNDESHFKIAAIMVDPGHGGKDTGATGMHNINGKKIELIEKNITLNVANELWKRLKSAFPSKKILITRTGDTYPTLQTRVAMANSVELKDNEAIIYIA